MAQKKKKWIEKFRKVKKKRKEKTTKRLSKKYISAPWCSTYLFASTRVAPMNKMNKMCHPQQAYWSRKWLF